MTFLAALGWPTATVIVGVLAFLTIVSCVAVWQVMATGRSVAGGREKEYRKLAEELTAMQRDTTNELQKANEALSHLRTQTQELERGLKELDRILKAVE